MIDWLSFTLPYSGPSVGDHYFRLDWESDALLPAWNRHAKCEGSYSSAVLVHVIGGKMNVTGNPVKYLTGQNVVGPDDAGLLVRLTVDAVREKLNLPACVQMRRAIENGDVNIRRADCTYHYHVGDEDDARQWLRAMETACHVRFRGRGHYDEGMASLLFGVSVKPGEKPKGSRYSTFKFYLKSEEIRKHPIRAPHWAMAELNALCEGHIRAEALYRHPELSEYNANWLHQWTSTTAMRLHKAWVDKMEISPQVELQTSQVKELPRWLRPTYLLWAAGEDVREVLSRPTFYRHRKSLMAHGIDIAVPGKERPKKVVPVLRVLEAKPACIERGPALFERLLAAA
ncbi:MAG: phage/plasmid replication protein, II/X family [Pseudomonadota bacterium]